MNRSIEYENWKGKPFVKLYKSIKPYKCTECSGKGYNNCSCDSGLIQCNKCNGNTTNQCQNCQGKGQKGDKINITDGFTGNKKPSEISYQCPTCFGNTTVTCSNCAGLGKIGHSNCNFTGKIRCNVCNGTGQLVDIIEEPVPIKSAFIDIFVSGVKKNSEHEQIVQLIKDNRYNLK